ncbi:MAG: class I SAM-dependent methyltransferase [Nitriliruptorales bacterium]|nr:class I SAM-dependent methyltransferase [Nitriliruptorales bacterium]
MAAFTGERPGRGRGYEYDDSRHQAAYRAVVPFVVGRRVVDAGSGDGEGTSLLAGAASHVTGLDHHQPSVELARERYGNGSTEFRVADLSVPWPVEAMDVVVAFQIIEHFDDDDAFVRNALGALRPGGRAIITTPNRLRSFSENPYHVREYTAGELAELLHRHGELVELMGVFGNERVEAFDERRQAQVEKWLRLDPLRLRDRLPRPVVERAFAILSGVVRRGAQRDTSERDAPITVDDFEVREGDLDTCLDLFAVVEKR